MKLLASLTILGLLSFAAVPVAWGGAANAAAYVSMLDNAVRLENAGDSSLNNFTLPSAALVNEAAILGLFLNCSGEGSGIDFDVQVLLNGISVKSYRVASGVERVYWEIVQSGALVTGTNELQLLASGDDIGHCDVSDVVLTFRLTTAP